MFVFRDNKAVFTPVKTGIAGERYFEVLDGLKAGDRVITGPFASVRELADGEEVRLQAGSHGTPAQAPSRAQGVTATHEVDESDPRLHPDRAAGHLGQQAASFMTVLGNIVAVTSIVTVVSLIQGMNAMVSATIVSDIGADSFTIQRRGIVRSEEDEERTRNNPLLTMDEADAIRDFGDKIDAVVAQAQPQRTVSLRHDGARERPDPGRHERVLRTSPTTTPNRAG